MSPILFFKKVRIKPLTANFRITVPVLICCHGNSIILTYTKPVRMVVETILKRKVKAPESERSRSSKVNADLDETFEMEITEDMMEFFRQSEEHRRLRDDEKQAVRESAEKEEEHINIEDVKVTVQKGPTTEAPKGRPGAKRTSEMKLLYGKGAPMVHGMETAFQMTFDRNRDIKEPKLWPNMLLKLVFG